MIAAPSRHLGRYSVGIVGFGLLVIFPMLMANSWVARQYGTFLHLAILILVTGAIAYALHRSIVYVDANVLPVPGGSE